jgi:hypothetical protein
MCPELELPCGLLDHELAIVVKGGGRHRHTGGCQDHGQGLQKMIHRKALMLPQECCMKLTVIQRPIHK